MTWTIKQRPHVAGAPMTCDYECPKHGRFEALVERDANGDPPSEAWCQASETAEQYTPDPNGRRPDGTWPYGPQRQTEAYEFEDHICGLASPWRISAPSLKRDSVPCYAAVRGGDTDRRPGMLDTRPLAEGMPMREWKAKQKAAQQERRHHQLIDRGLKTKRVQV